MNARTLFLILRFAFGLVWLVFGLFGKLLPAAPRHAEIVGRVLGDEHALLLTRCIGLGEVLFAFWIWSGIRSRWAAVLQMMLVAVMNILEFSMARNLLMWGSLNALFAVGFIALVGWHEFRLKARIQNA